MPKAHLFLAQVVLASSLIARFLPDPIFVAFMTILTITIILGVMPMDMQNNEGEVQALGDSGSAKSPEKTVLTSTLTPRSPSPKTQRAPSIVIPESPPSSVNPPKDTPISPRSGAPVLDKQAPLPGPPPRASRLRSRVDLLPDEDDLHHILFDKEITSVREDSERGIQIQIASDLHIELVCETPNISGAKMDEIVEEMIVPSAPILVLAGDIGCPGTFRGFPFLEKFLMTQASRFEYVFYVAGNHEYYSQVSGFTGACATAPDVHKIIRQMCDKIDNVFFLDRKVAVINGIRIVGATLWSHINDSQVPDIEAHVSDYKRIHMRAKSKSPFVATRLLRTHDAMAWHRYDLQFLEEQVDIAERNREEMVIITHHAPSFNGTSHRCHSNSKMSTAFATDLERLCQPHVKAWIFGHTHFCSDQMINRTRLVSNQRGYYYDRESEYRPDCVIEIR